MYRYRFVSKNVLLNSCSLNWFNGKLFFLPKAVLCRQVYTRLVIKALTIQWTLFKNVNIKKLDCETDFLNVNIKKRYRETDSLNVNIKKLHRETDFLNVNIKKLYRDTNFLNVNTNKLYRETDFSEYKHIEALSWRRFFWMLT